MRRLCRIVGCDGKVIEFTIFQALNGSSCGGSHIDRGWPLVCVSPKIIARFFPVIKEVSFYVGTFYIIPGQSDFTISRRSGEECRRWRGIIRFIGSRCFAKETKFLVEDDGLETLGADIDADDGDGLISRGSGASGQNIA